MVHLMGISDKRRPLYLLAVVLLLSLLMFSAGAQAAAIDLIIGENDAIPWNVDNIAPGDSGVTTLVLQNAGDKEGYVILWFENISTTDMAGDGTALDQYIRFNLTHSRLVSSVPLPAQLSALPQGPEGEQFIKISSLRAGETINIIWEWEFTENGLPQNDAQGDSLSFDLNILLREPLPSAPGGGGDDSVVVHTVTPTVTPVPPEPAVPTLPVVSPGSSGPVNAPISGSGNVLEIVQETPPLPNEQFPAAVPWPFYIFPLIIGAFILIEVTRRNPVSEKLTAQWKFAGIAGLILVIAGMICGEVGCPQTSQIHFILDGTTIGVLLFAAALGYTGLKMNADISGWIYRLHRSFVISGVVLLFMVIISYLFFAQ